MWVLPEYKERRARVQNTPNKRRQRRCNLLEHETRLFCFNVSVIRIRVRLVDAIKVI